ncbi:hypothetical protein KM043_009889 [Ampulex compressa]|nr:hypothetical protein KM043_009889 [Ampulex compressa]
MAGKGRTERKEGAERRIMRAVWTPANRGSGQSLRQLPMGTAPSCILNCTFDLSELVQTPHRAITLSPSSIALNSRTYDTASLKRMQEERKQLITVIKCGEYLL